MANEQPFPSNSAPIASRDGIIGQVWYYLLQTIWLRSGGAGGALPASSIAVGASPFEYEADVSGTVLVDGGTVTEIAISRAGSSYVTGAIAGPIPVMRGDAVQVTHAGAPTMTFLPTEATGS